MQYRKGEFITVPNKRLLRQLDAISQAVFLWICNYANQKGFCYPSIRTLASNTRTSKNTVKNRISLLRDRGFIAVTHRKRGGKNDSNLYQVLIINRSRDGPPRSAVDPPMGQELGSNSNNKEKTHNPLGERIMEEFISIDPNNKTKLTNHKQQKACDFLIEEYGLSTVLEVIKLLPRTNRTPYFPSINDPYELKEKWKKLEDALHRKRTSSIEEGRGIA